MAQTRKRKETKDATRLTSHLPQKVVYHQLALVGRERRLPAAGVPHAGGTTRSALAASRPSFGLSFSEQAGRAEQVVSGACEWSSGSRRACRLAATPIRRACAVKVCRRRETILEAVRPRYDHVAGRQQQDGSSNHEIPV